MLWCWSPTSSWLGLAWSPAPSWGPSSQAALGVLPSVAASCLTCLSRLCGASWQTFWLRCHCPFAWFAPHPVIGLALEYRDVPPDRPSLHHHPLFFLRPLQASAINHYNAPSWRINQKDMLKKTAKDKSLATWQKIKNKGYFWKISDAVWALSHGCLRGKWVYNDCKLGPPTAPKRFFTLGLNTWVRTQGLILVSFGGAAHIT